MSQKPNEESSERFASIIDYPNFLMQVLKIYVKTQLKDSDASKIALDDKTLLESFKKHDYRCKSCKSLYLPSFENTIFIRSIYH